MKFKVKIYVSKFKSIYLKIELISVHLIYLKSFFKQFSNKFPKVIRLCHKCCLENFTNFWFSAATKPKIFLNNFKIIFGLVQRQNLKFF